MADVYQLVLKIKVHLKFQTSNIFLQPDSKQTFKHINFKN